MEKVFPGMLNFKTVIENRKEKVDWKVEQMELLAQRVSSKIENVVKYCNII